MFTPVDAFYTVAIVLVIAAAIMGLMLMRSHHRLRAIVPFHGAERLAHADSPSRPSRLPAVPVSAAQAAPVRPMIKSASSEQAPQATDYVLRRLEFARWCVQHGILNEFPADAPALEREQQPAIYDYQTTSDEESLLAS
jgi:hypothetical protein